MKKALFILFIMFLAGCAQYNYSGWETNGTTIKAVNGTKEVRLENVNLTIVGYARIYGNLTINGTLTTINKTNLTQLLINELLDSDETNFFDGTGSASQTLTSIDSTGAITYTTISITKSQVSDFNDANCSATNSCSEIVYSNNNTALSRGNVTDNNHIANSNQFIRGVDFGISKNISNYTQYQVEANTFKTSNFSNDVKNVINTSDLSIRNFNASIVNSTKFVVNNTLEIYGNSSCKIIAFAGVNNITLCV